MEPRLRFTQQLPLSMLWRTLGIVLTSIVGCSNSVAAASTTLDQLGIPTATTESPMREVLRAPVNPEIKLIAFSFMPVRGQYRPGGLTEPAGVRNGARCTRVWGYNAERFPSRRASTTIMKATAKATNKSKAKKKSKGKAIVSANQGGGGGGFGSPSQQPTATITQEDEEVNARGSSGGQLPDDDFGTFPPLSPGTMGSIMGVDVFDLPAGGVSARVGGQKDALPFQVLQTIRGRHGFPEFAGGQKLLDAAYGTAEEVSDAERQIEASDADERQRQTNDSSESTKQKHELDVDATSGATRSKANLLFPGVRLLHAEPPVIGVDDFFTSEECDHYVAMSADAGSSAKEDPGKGGSTDTMGEGGPHMQRSATLGADVDAVAQRTSTTWFHRYSAVPELMAKASALLGIPFKEGRWEEAQTVRYRPGEKFTWHLDALPPSPDLAIKGGQRIATLLVYLTELQEDEGGATAFRDLGPLRVRPRKGSALLFFPSCGGAPECPFDIRTLHAGEVVRPGGKQEKWIAQLWLRESRYTPSVPKGNDHAAAESAVSRFSGEWKGRMMST